MTAPNVVLIMADQHRWDFVGYEREHGNGVTHTPRLDALAAQGTVFGSAYCTAPLCSPSRAAIALGRYGMNSGCYTNLHRPPPGSDSFVQQFRSAGYHTSVIGKTHMEIHAYDSDLLSESHRRYMDSLGWSEAFEADQMVRHGIRCQYGEFLRGNGWLDDYLRFEAQWSYFMEAGQKADPGFLCHEWTLPEHVSLTSFVGDRTVEWLRRWDRAQPFLLQVGFVAPHEPICPLPRYMDRYRDAEETSPWNAPHPPAWLADGRRGYRAMISHVDEYVGRICDRLAEQGLLENTIVVYTADHGEMAGDQGALGKTTFFEGSVRVPLLFAGPEIQPGQRSAALVETLDIGRTLCDLAGVAPHALDQGRSLVPVLRGERAAHRDTVYCEMGCDRMLRDTHSKLMWGEPRFDRRQLGRLHLDKPVNIAPSPAGLYDLHADPHENRNLADEPAQREVVMTMLQRLVTRINENTQTQPFLSRGEYRPLTPRKTALTD